MHKIAVILIMFTLLVQETTCQEHFKIDSLRNKLEMELTDTVRVQVLNEIAEEYMYNDHEKIIEYAQQALEISEDINYMKGIAVSKNNLGSYYRLKGIYNESIDYYFSALEIMENLKDINGIARCYNLIGILYYVLNNYDLSLEYYFMALEINYQQNDKKWIAGNSNNVGMIFQKQGSYEKALEFYLKSLEMNIAVGNKNWIGNNYANIGSLYQLMNDPSSIDYFRKCLRIKEEQSDTAGIANSYYLIGNYYVYKSDMATAIPYLTQAHTLALKSQTLSVLDKASEKISEALYETGDYASALEFEKLNKIYNDSLMLTANTDKITRLQIQYKHKKDEEIKRMLYEQSIITQSLIAVALLLIFLFILLVYNRQRFRTKQHTIDQEKLLISNKLLQEELEFKDKMLHDNITYLMNINELLTETINKFNKIKSTSSPENQKVIKDIINNLHSGIDDDFWEEFELRFNQIHKDFYHKLNTHNSDLSPNEKKLCAYLKLNMTTKEIAAITSLSIKSIETARSRLRKKLNIQDKKVSLSEFLNNF